MCKTMAYLAAFALCLLAFRLTSGTPVVFTDCGKSFVSFTDLTGISCVQLLLLRVCPFPSFVGTDEAVFFV